VTEAYAVCPSWEMVLVVNGSVTEATCGAVLIAVTAFSMAACWALAVSLVLPSVVNTTVAPALSAPTPIFSLRTSSAWNDSVPGMEKALVVGPDRVAAPTPSRPRMTTQSSSMRPRRR
jgi:hypothetical protein